MASTKVKLERIDNAFYFRAENENGNVMEMDASMSIGGHNLGVRPMEAVLMGLGGCSGIDIVMILKKQRQEIEGLRINIEGEREEGVEPSLYKTIHVEFFLDGRLNPDKVRMAVMLSMEKYCSVAKILEETAVITYTVKINNEVLELESR
jgi:putative redox protein